MKTKWLFTLFIACLCTALTVNSAHASKKIKYGEWKVHIAVQGLPIAVPVQTQRICLEKNHLVPSARNEHGCKMKWALKGNTVHWTMKCSNGGNGNGEATYEGKKMHGRSEINIPSAHRSMHSKITGEWVAATCSAQSRH